MFGPFRQSMVTFGGYVHKQRYRWRLSPTQKAGQRKRIKAVDSVMDVLRSSMEKLGVTPKFLIKAETECPPSSAMLPKDKYTVFSKNHKGYRKSVHRVPNFTKTTNRKNPLGF
ncbi:mitochondrial 54S ribosomal protein YmL31 [Yarrowia lipolytica]|nr:mitochondrial 54S ribosomal protein YmL31 [Yarrowia lipolytica]RDW56268.1 mitochondrial 54S ribosomal protein YmL31 [Yarrowia lipolytica]